MNTTEPNMDPRLDTSDWAEVFGEGTGGNCTPIKPQPAPPSYNGSLITFSRADVVEIFQMVEGENDGPPWVVYGRLRDGRFFVATGSCDYTGWDCQAGNSGSVATTREAIIRFGLTDEDRNRFGITL